jgi:hypothetical protein
MEGAVCGQSCPTIRMIACESGNVHILNRQRDTRFGSGLFNSILVSESSADEYTRAVDFTPRHNRQRGWGRISRSQRMRGNQHMRVVLGFGGSRWMFARRYTWLVLVCSYDFSQNINNFVSPLERYGMRTRIAFSPLRTIRQAHWPFE